MYNLRIIKCNSRLEIYKVHNYIIRKSKKHEGFKRIEKLQKEIEKSTSKEEVKKSNKQSKKNRVATLTAARNNIIRLIKCNDDMTTFITLTFAKEQDYKESKKSLDNLFHKLRKRYKNLKYLWVLEYGDINHRLHFHVLTNMPMEIKLNNSNEVKSKEHKLLEQSFSASYWKYGWVDIRSLAQEDNTNVALYVSSYIVKSLKDVDLEGYRIYGYSQKTLEKPIEEKIFCEASIEQILSRYGDYELKFTNSYPIGYTDWKGNHLGNVTYFDLNKKECINNESK
ncbi:hypothetical protein [Clostridium sp. YIM B02569]|uniref:rolling circle replication-associated protein n=1 Tax=Clostridium sp. YIM B02569 TaxID=2911967 RepID=UPI001EEC4480|nr:hypothetical protein [Clostridium sp. YIM B02569]